jgi:predicted RNase H-like HicB family nuclease
LEFTAVFQKVPLGTGECYIGWVKELPGANTQGDTLEEARHNLRDAIQLILETNRELAEERASSENVIVEKLSIPAQ